VLPNRAVTIDGRLYTAGEVVAVSAADARTLTDEGYAERVRGR
jgi:hypothetical protein